MKVTPESIWRAPAYLPYLQPKITPQLIRAAEQEIGFDLPKEYLALLDVQNGGYIRYSLVNSHHELISGIGPHFPSITGFDWTGAKEFVSFSLDGLVPFDGDGHWYICLDYRKNAKEPSVSNVYIEVDSESMIANSFKEYLRLLKPVVSENEFVITSTADIELVKGRLAKSLRAKIEETDTYAHGYPIHRLSVGRFGDPEWVSISSNVVPCGFVREDDTRYAELRDLMAGEAKRYPELPEVCCLLSASGAIRSKVQNALSEASIVAKPLIEFLK